LLAGCFQALLQAEPSTTLGFTCTLMDPTQADSIVLESWVEPGTWLTPANASTLLARFVPLLANLTGRPAGSISWSLADAPSPPAAGWNRTNLAGQAGPFLRQRVATMRIWWVASLREPATGLVAAPGAVAVALDSVAAAADRIGHPRAEVAFGVLLHQAGHALGETNQGVPVQDPDLQEREGPPGHDKDPTSVLNAGWDDARTLTWAANATYAGYPAADLADWAAARVPGGVCT